MLARGPKFFKLKMGEREDTVSRDRLKPYMAVVDPVPAALRGRGRPPGAVPAVVVILVGVVILAGRKNKDVVENPLVDFAVMTVGVFAFAAVFRFAAVKADAPGLARFFGGK